jgi:hypothetical protein
MREPVRNWKDFGEETYPPHLIDAGNLPAALNAFALREMLDYRMYGRYHSDVWICGFGVVMWMMGDCYGAARVWSRVCDEVRSGKIKYSSTGTYQAGLLLWFAAVWLKDEDWREDANVFFSLLLTKRRPPIGSDFPSLLARYLRREIDLLEVKAGYKDQLQNSQDSYELEALFYAGVRAYADGNIDETRQIWSEIKGLNYSSLSLEHHLLTFEKKKLGW